MAGVAFSAGTVGVSAAILLASSEVGYTGNGQTSVEGALNDLYERAKAMESAITFKDEPSNNYIRKSETVTLLSTSLKAYRYTSYNDNDYHADTTLTTFSDWTNLAGGGGSYNDGNENNKDTSYLVSMNWEIPYTQNFYQARAVKIILYSRADNATDEVIEGLGESYFYTKIHYGTSNINIIPIVIINKQKNSNKVTSVQSNIDYFNDSAVTSVTDDANTNDNVFSKMSVTYNNYYNYFSLYVPNDNSKILLSYDSHNDKSTDNYTGIVRYDRTKDYTIGDAYGYNVIDKGKWTYWAKNYPSTTYAYGGSHLTLQARYNGWNVDITYYI